MAILRESRFHRAAERARIPSIRALSCLLNNEILDWIRFITQ